MNSDFFLCNRRRLIEMLPGSLIILTANSKMQSYGYSTYKFKQDSNFWWLTGINEPDWIVVIDSKKSHSYLVSPDLSDVARLFDGGMSDSQAIVSSGVDEVVSHADFLKKLDELSKNYADVKTINNITDVNTNFVINAAHSNLRLLLTEKFNEVNDCRLSVEKLRAIKQPIEIRLMRRVIDLTVDAFRNIKQHINDYEYEYQIEASIGYSFKNGGSGKESFDTIVAGGKNACTLHYSSNQDKIVRGNFVLIDAGANMNSYSSDISRTYACGDVSDRHKKVHEVTLNANRQIIGLLRPGLGFDDYHAKVDEIMTDAIRQLGLPWENNQYKKYFPHSIGHGLGIDAHDPLGQYQEFLPGMVVTVEPGIYIPDEGIGVRIEDDILITDSGYDNLSQALSAEM